MKMSGICRISSGYEASTSISRYHCAWPLLPLPTESGRCKHAAICQRRSVRITGATTVWLWTDPPRRLKGILFRRFRQAVGDLNAKLLPINSGQAAALEHADTQLEWDGLRGVPDLLLWDRQLAFVEELRVLNILLDRRREKHAPAVARGLDHTIVHLSCNQKQSVRNCPRTTSNCRLLVCTYQPFASLRPQDC